MNARAKPETPPITDFKKALARGAGRGIERKAAPGKREGARMKNFGSLYLLAVAHIACTSTDAAGLLYISQDGEMLITDDDASAPMDARYVSRIGPNVDPLFVAARLRHVVRFLG